MRNNLSYRLFCLVFSLLLIGNLCSLSTYAKEYTVNEVSSLVDGITIYKLNQSSSNQIQNWIDGTITKEAGVSSEWYAIALSQNGQYNFQSYEQKLLDYLANNSVASPTTREKYALALVAVGSSNPYIEEILDSSIGQQGIMSWIFGLHILNNGYTCQQYSRASVSRQLISMQLGDGGWSLSGGNGDIDVTAMTLQALASCRDCAGVEDAINRGIAFLSERQLEDGGFQSYGVENPESSAQVLTALSALGIDCEQDARFIKNDCGIFDNMEMFHLSAGGYTHTIEGGYNEMATTQVYYAYISYLRMKNGKTPLYIMDHKQSIEKPSIETDTQPATENHTTQTTPPKHTEHRQTNTTEKKAVTEIKSTEQSDCMHTESNTNAKNNTADITESTENAENTESTEEQAFSSNENFEEEWEEKEASISESEQGEYATNSSLQNDTEDAITSTEHPSQSAGYKPVATVVIVFFGILIATILYLKNKRNGKDYLLVAFLTGGCILIVWLTDIQSADEYYNGTKQEKENAIGTVTLTIRCDTVLGKSDREDIPADGIILDVAEFSIAQGDTVFDILAESAQEYHIALDHRGGNGNNYELVYVEGIQYLYEFDFGDLSGWMYHVNGTEPSVGCGAYALQDGDVIEWLYTCDLGHDLKENASS